jgi:glycosyltransferase involved in cell wall biosynthesis
MSVSDQVPNSTRSLPVRSLSVLFVDASEFLDNFLNQLPFRLADHEIRITIASKDKPKSVKHPQINWVYLPARSDSVWTRITGYFQKIPTAIVRFSKIIRVTAAERARRRGLSGNLDLFFRVLPFAVKNWDVIYFPQLFSAIELMPLMDLGRKTIVSYTEKLVNVPGNSQNRSLHESIYNVLQRASIVHCETEDLLKKLSQMGIDPEKTVVVRPGVDVDFFRPRIQEASEDPESFRVISVAPLTWKSGHHISLLAIKILLDKGVPVFFDLIGEGPELQHMLFTIQDLGLEQRVRLLHPSGPEKLLNHLQNSNVLLVSNLLEGFSVNLLQSMSCGLPVVASDCGGIREAITPDVEGVIVPLRDSETIADALYKFWKEPEVTKRMSAAARERIVKDFRISDQVVQFKKLLMAVSRNTSSRQDKRAIE